MIYIYHFTNYKVLNFDHNLSNYEIIVKIGQGAYGKVYKIKSKKDSNIYAAKE